MLLDLNVELEDVEGKKADNSKMSVNLCNFLQTINYPAINCVKGWLWAKELAKNGSVEIDIVDIKIVKQYIEYLRIPNPSIPSHLVMPGILAQLIIQIDKCIDEYEKSQQKVNKVEDKK